MGLHAKQAEDASRFAPEGAIWICRACGSSGKDLYQVGDESCMLNSVLCSEASIRRSPEGRIRSANAFVPPEEAKPQGSRGPNPR